jgi:endonuclease/exonuclease/phosphatase (EEP) superfamily protein YafD
MKNNNNIWTSLSFLGLLQVVATITVILSILTLFDGLHRYIELFSHFKSQYLLASITSAIIFVFYKNYKYTIVLLLIALLNLVFILPWYFPNQDYNSGNTEVDLSLLQCNVLTNNEDFKGLLELVNHEKPDIIVMQEVNQLWLSETQELESVYIHKHTIPREDNFGIAIFSKLPFESLNVIDSGAFEVPTIVASFFISEQLVTIIATHPLPPVGDQYYQTRKMQIKETSKMSRDHKGPLIVIGDLNVSMWSHDYKPLVQETGLRNARKGFGLLPTWPTQFQLPIFRIPIDHVLVSSEFKVQNIKLGADIGSDHLPLIVKLGLKK